MCAPQFKVSGCTTSISGAVGQGSQYLLVLMPFYPPHLSAATKQRQSFFHTQVQGFRGEFPEVWSPFYSPVTAEWHVENPVHWESTLKTTTECLIINMAMRLGHEGDQSLAARVTGCCLPDLA